jgi:hypothetical protein
VAFHPIDAADGRWIHIALMDEFAQGFVISAVVAGGRDEYRAGNKSHHGPIFMASR